MAAPLYTLARVQQMAASGQLQLDKSGRVAVMTKGDPTGVTWGEESNTRTGTFRVIDQALVDRLNANTEDLQGNPKGSFLSFIAPAVLAAVGFTAAGTAGAFSSLGGGASAAPIGGEAYAAAMENIALAEASGGALTTKGGALVSAGSSLLPTNVPNSLPSLPAGAAKTVGSALTSALTSSTAPGQAPSATGGPGGVTIVNSAQQPAAGGADLRNVLIAAVVTGIVALIAKAA